MNHTLRAAHDKSRGAREDGRVRLAIQAGVSLRTRRRSASRSRTDRGCGPTDWRGWGIDGIRRFANGHSFSGWARGGKVVGFATHVRGVFVRGISSASATGGHDSHDKEKRRCDCPWSSHVQLLLVWVLHLNLLQSRYQLGARVVAQCTKPLNRGTETSWLVRRRYCRALAWTRFSAQYSPCPL